MTIQEIYKNYPEQWVLIRVLEENDEGETTKADLICASKDRNEVYDAIKDVEDGSYVETMYTGDSQKSGQVFAF